MNSSSSMLRQVATEAGSAAASAFLPGGGRGASSRALRAAAARRELRHVAKAQTAVASAAKTTRPSGAAPIVTAVDGGGKVVHQPAAVRAAFEASSQDPSTLDSRKGPVKLTGPDLSSLRSESGEDDQLFGLRTTLLNDGALSKTPAELEAVRQQVLDYFHGSYSRTEKLHAIFSNTPAFFAKHETLRHPPIFYFGHTAAFYVNKLHLGKFITDRIDPVLEMQMSVGVDEMSWDDLDSSSYVWPSGAEARADQVCSTEFVQKVLDFRHSVRNMVDGLISTQPMEWPIAKDSFWWVILMGIEHDNIHLETSSVIYRQAPLSCVQNPGLLPECDLGRFDVSADSAAATSLPTNKLIPVEEGTTRLGRPWAGTSTYGWDNEFGKETNPTVPAFAASECLVSNAEFLAFVRDGGYTEERHWSEEGWRWVADMRPATPRFWRRQETETNEVEYSLRTMFREVPMPWDWPAEVCHHEAAAYCRYLSEKTGKQLRLPLEDEHLRLRDMEPTDLQRSAHGQAWQVAPGNVNLAHWASPCPVDTFRSPGGVCDVLGNVWQHCLTPIDVMEGFETHPLYDDFTTPTVGVHHKRIMGGSWISTGCNGATRDSRYGFRPHFTQHAGFRYVESNRKVSSAPTPFERDRQLCDQFRFHFEPSTECSEEYPVALAKRCADVARSLGMPFSECRVLELGCGPGRTVLELARQGASVAHGTERTSSAFQLTAQRLLQDNGRLRWTNYVEGDFVVHKDFHLRELGLTDAARDRVRFFQVPDFAVTDTQKFSNYDVVVMAQPGALGGSSDPMQVLGHVHRLVRPGGLLVVGTQYEWPVASSSPRRALAEGARNGEQVVQRALQQWFDQVAEPSDLPYVKVETARKTEAGVQHLTFWRRVANPEGDASAVSENSPQPGAFTQGVGGVQGQGMYEQISMGGTYLDFHFGPTSTYPAECARRCVEAAQRLGVPTGRALEVGGGPGRAAIELSRSYGHVDGGDYSRQFVDQGNELLTKGELRWRSVVDQTAGHTVERSVQLHDLAPGSSLKIAHMDAMNLDIELTGYDLICGFNLIDRLARPREFLLAARTRLNPGGLLVLSSPYTWLEDFTPKEEWLGAYKYGDNDGPSSHAGLKEFLERQGFAEALQAEDVEFRIEELGNGRKNQQTRAQMTFWRLPA